jgi:hypothetical protein
MSKYENLSTPSYYRFQDDFLETIYKKGTHYNYYYYHQLEIINKWDRWNLIIVKDQSGLDGREWKTKGFSNGDKLFHMKDDDYLQIQKRIKRARKKKVREEKIKLEKRIENLKVVSGKL